jgi:flavin reductase (DIM6/NTAB) family NADH-FMN oxidoreductase RutF
MSKTLMDPKNLFYPKPVFLIGANIDGKPNFMVVATGCAACADPPMVCISMRPRNYTLKGIRQTLTFSINLPSADLIRETDYCGLVSGSEVNKVKVCQFKIFYGRLGNAPLIEQCPVNVECRVVNILDLGSHSLIIGNIQETYVSDECLIDKTPDFNKINPLIYTQSLIKQYHTLGAVTAQAHSIGNELKAREYKLD